MESGCFFVLSLARKLARDSRALCGDGFNQYRPMGNFKDEPPIPNYTFLIDAKAILWAAERGKQMFDRPTAGRRVGEESASLHRHGDFRGARMKKHGDLKANFGI